jgi:hypothetical protein
MAAIFNLSHNASYVQFHIGHGATPFFAFSMSVSNVIVIVLGLVVFVAALLLPFPGHRTGEGVAK